MHLCYCCCTNCYSIEHKLSGTNFDMLQSQLIEVTTLYSKGTWWVVLVYLQSRITFNFLEIEW